MPNPVFGPVSLTTLTPLAKDIFNRYTQPEADLSGNKGPPNMASLVEGIQSFGWKVKGHPLSVELIVAALRAASFRSDLAADILFLGTWQDPRILAFASTPGQLKYVQHFVRDTFYPRSEPEPVNMGKMITALDSLGLTDDEGRPFCKEVLEAALRRAGYFVFAATELLLAVTGQHIEGSWGLWGVYATQEQVTTGLRQLFPKLDWSTLAAASADAARQEGQLLAKVIDVASQIDELKAEFGEEYYIWPRK
jgi:hypothetical protein